MATIWSTYAVAWGSRSGSFTPIRRMPSYHTASNSTATSAGSRPSSLPLAMMASSMSVMFET